MGFCLFNNVAVAAEAARAAGASRVMILDWDVHHGNGTQHTFEARSDVLFCSSHQFPFYPGTGAPSEVGVGEGAGYTVNVALPRGMGDADYGAVFHDVFLPIAQKFRPELVLVSAGFDPHRADPLGGMNVTERGFAAMASADPVVTATGGSGDLYGPSTTASQPPSTRTNATTFTSTMQRSRAFDVPRAPRVRGGGWARRASDVCWMTVPIGWERPRASATRTPL